MIDRLEKLMAIQGVAGVNKLSLSVSGASELAVECCGKSERLRGA